MYICNIYIYVLYNIYISVFIIWCAYSMYLYIGVYDMCVCIVYIYICVCMCVCACVCGRGWGVRGVWLLGDGTRASLSFGGAVACAGYWWPGVWWWGAVGAVAWRAVHEHMVAGAFHSKKSLLALLVHEQQASQKRCLLNQLLVVKKMEYICEHKQNVQSD